MYNDKETKVKIKENRKKQGNPMERTFVPDNSEKADKKPVIRSFKDIDPFYILDTDYARIMLVGSDEYFVRLPKYRNFWLSNYGRGLTVIAGKYRFLRSKKVNGQLCYVLEQIIHQSDPECTIEKTVPVDQLVVDTFIEITDRHKRKKIWHAGNDEEDFYYLNLYPVTRREYKAIKGFFDEHGYDTEQDIMHILNEEREFLPTVCNRGYWGEKGVDVFSDSYIRWANMMRRCYSESFQKIRPSYVGCTVCEEWWNYSNFRKWLEENLYQIGTETMCLDKDILHKGNKVYSPENCVVCPESVNLLFIKCDKSRGDLPIGVIEVDGKYVAKMRYSSSTKNLGTYDTPEEAFRVYKKYKEQFICDLAEKYREKGIPEKLYDAMLRWKVEIED